MAGAWFMRPCHHWAFMLFLAVLFGFDPVLGDKHDDEKRLKDTIMREYKKDALPDNTALTGLGFVNVSIYITPLYIDVDEDAEVMNQHCWFYLEWQDSRLRWDPKDYGGINTIHMPNKKLWVPDVYVYDSQVHTDRSQFDVVIKATGPQKQEMIWVPAIDTRTYCKLDYTYWPWDVQNCRYSIGSWTKFGDQLDVGMLRNETTVWPMYSSNRWNARKITAKKTSFQFETDVLGEKANVTYSELSLTYQLQRVSGIDQKLALLPLTVLCCLTLATFWTFPLDRNRILIGLFNMAIGIAWLAYMRARLPGAGGQIPMIVLFMGSTVVLITVQLIAALAVANLVSRKDSPPTMLIGPLDNGATLGKILFLNSTPLVGKIEPGMPGYTLDVEQMKSGNSNDQANGAGQAETGTTSSSQSANDGWNLLAQAIDRMLFVAYFLIICIYYLTYIAGASST